MRSSSKEGLGLEGLGLTGDEMRSSSKEGLGLTGDEMRSSSKEGLGLTDDEMRSFSRVCNSLLGLLVKYPVLSLVTGYIIANFFDWSIMCKKPNN